MVWTASRQRRVRASGSSRPSPARHRRVARRCRARVGDGDNRLARERRGAGRGGERVVDARRQDGFVRRDRVAFAAEDVEDADVLAALPDRVALRVAEQPGEPPVLAVAVAAVQLDRERTTASTPRRQSRTFAAGTRMRRSVRRRRRMTRPRTRSRAQTPPRARTAGRRAARGRAGGRRGAGPSPAGGAPRSPTRGRSGGRCRGPSSPHRSGSR